MTSPLLAGSPGRACRILAVSYTLIGTAVSACAFYASTLPVTIPGDGPVLPAWLRVAGFAMGTLLGLPWALLPVPLLITGLVQARRAASAPWRWAAAWTMAVAAGSGLEVLVITGAGDPYPGPSYQGPEIMSWAALAEAAGFAALSAIMIAIVNGTARARQVPARATAGRWCRALAAGFAVLNAVSCATRIYPPARLGSALFGWLNHLNRLPGWLGQVGFYAELALPALWVLLPVPLLFTGIVHVRRAAPARWRWVAAWSGAIAGGVLLEVVSLAGPLSGYFPPARAVDWVPAAQTAGFLAVGAAMIWVVRRAERTPQPAATGETAAG